MPRKKKIVTDTEQVTEQVEGTVEGNGDIDEEQKIRFKARDYALSLYDEKTYGTTKLSRMTSLILKCRAMNPGTREREYRNGAELVGFIDAYFQVVQREQEAGAQVIADVESLAAFLGLTRNTLNRWARGEANMEFVVPVQLAMNEIASGKKQMAWTERVNALVFQADMMNNHDYVQKQDKTEVNLSIRMKQDLPPLEQLNRPMALLDSK
jgi:hypothetical protein